FYYVILSGQHESDGQRGEPDQKILGDFSIMFPCERVVYLAGVLGLWSRSGIKYLRINEMSSNAQVQTRPLRPPRGSFRKSCGLHFHRRGDRAPARSRLRMWEFRAN